MSEALRSTTPSPDGLDGGEFGGGVFHVVDTLRIGGAERMAVDVSNALGDRGWGVHLIATRESGPLEKQVRPGVDLICLGRSSRFNLRGLHRFRRLLCDVRPMLVHAHGWSSLQFCTAGLVGVRSPPPLVFHDHMPAGLSSPPRSYVWSAWLYTSAHIAVDHALLRRRLRTRKHALRAVVPNGIPLDRFTRGETRARSATPRLVMTANLRPQKDHFTFVSALSQLKTSGVETQTDFVGALSDLAYTDACRHLIEALELVDDIAMVGPCEDVGSILSSYDLGVISSSTESGPVALIEYMASGLPFVVTDVGEVTASLNEELRRWVVPPGDPVALATKIREALEITEAERERIGALGRAHVEEFLSIEQTVDSIEKVYRLIIQ